MKTWNARIAERRQALGLSKSEFARRCEVSAPTVNDWENGEIKKLEAVNLLKICRVLKIEAEWLMFGIGHPEDKEKPLLSDEADALIKEILRLDGAGDLARKTFALHRGLLLLFPYSETSEDATAGHPLLDEGERAAHEVLSRDRHSGGISHAGTRTRRDRPHGIQKPTLPKRAK
jgi:transcriptional regulator with XRE-family HTH domain